MMKKRKVKKGETLMQICLQEYGKDYYYPLLLEFNRIGNPNGVYTHQTIYIPTENNLLIWLKEGREK